MCCMFDKWVQSRWSTHEMENPNLISRRYKIQVLRCARSVKLKHTLQWYWQGPSIVLQTELRGNNPISMSFAIHSQLQSQEKPLCAPSYHYRVWNNMSRTRYVQDRKTDDWSECWASGWSHQGTFYTWGIQAAQILLSADTERTTCDVRCGDLRWCRGCQHASARLIRITARETVGEMDKRSHR